MENGRTMKSIIPQAALPVVQIGRLKLTGSVFVSSQLSVWRRLSSLINSELVIMAGAWYGYLKGAGDLVRNQALRTAISKAMDYWFGRDFTDLACLDQGGTDQCPCSDDTHFW